MIENIHYKSSWRLSVGPGGQGPACHPPGVQHGLHLVVGVVEAAGQLHGAAKLLQEVKSAVRLR